MDNFSERPSLGARCSIAATILKHSYFCLNLLYYLVILRYKLTQQIESRIFCGLETCEVEPQMCGEYAGSNSRMSLINILNVRQLVHHIRTGKGSETGQKFGAWLRFGRAQITGGDLKR